MKEEKPRVSVITVVKNGEQYLQRTISSVLRQNFKSMEYIIVDGGSTDGTVEIIKENENHIRQWTSGPDDGIFDGMNRGLAMSRGEWVWFLNADDYLEEGIMKKIFAGPGLKDAEIIYGNSRRYGDGYSYVVGERNLKDLNRTITFSHPSTLVRRDLMEAAGGFNPAFKLLGDYDLFCRLARIDPEVLYINQVFSSMREGGASGKLSNSLSRVKERYRADRIHFGPRRAWKNLAVLLVPGIIKKAVIQVLGKIGMGGLVRLYFKKKY